MKESLKGHAKCVGLCMLLCIPSYTFVAALLWIIDEITDRHYS